MKIHFWVYLLFLAQQSGHVDSSKHSRIVRGRLADKGEYPFMARLSIKGHTGYTLCGGTLISEQLVLSATHCLAWAQRPLTVKVILGDHIIGHNDTTEEVFEVGKIFIHKRWDAMLLKLKESHRISNLSHISPVGYSFHRPSVGAMVTAVGWGSKQTGGEGYSTHLQEIEMPVATRKMCNIELRSMKTVPLHPAEMCAGWANRQFSNVCKGDSGGPLLYKPRGTPTYKLVGIARRVANGRCPNNMHYGMFTSLSSISKWIRKHVNCNKIGKWFLINKHNPVSDGNDREIPVCPDGQKPLCMKCVVKSTASCKSVHPSCERKQRYACSMKMGLTCRRSSQAKVTVGQTYMRCPCCDYGIRALCPL